VADSVAFDRAAGYYDATRGFPPGAEDAVAALIGEVGRLTPASRVLEIGVGTGRIALPLARRVAGVAGVDLARPMLERLRAKQRGAPVQVIQGDIVRLPLAAQRFDAAVAVHIFHLVAGWRAALDEVRRALRPGGVLISGWGDNPRHELALQLLVEAWNAAVGDDYPPNVGVPRDAYRTFLPEAGWRLVGRGAYEYHSAESAAQFVAQLEARTWSSTWRMADDVHARGVAAVRAAIRAHGLDPNAPIPSVRAFNVEAYGTPDE